MHDLFTFANILSLIIGLISGALIFTFIYLNKVKGTINNIITKGNKKIKHSPELKRTIKYYKSVLKKKKILGIIPLKNKRDIKTLNEEILKIETNSPQKLTDLVFYLVKENARLAHPTSNMPLLEVTIENAYFNVMDIIIKVNRILDIKYISYLKKLKAKEVIYLYNLYRKTKDLLEKKVISIPVIIFKLIMVIVNIFGIAYWVKRASRALMISSTGDLIITSLLEIVDLETKSIYKPK